MNNGLRKSINEDSVVVDKNKTQFKYIILPHNVTARQIHDQYPEVIFTGESKRTLDDAVEYIKYFKQDGYLYALKLGFDDKWLIGGYITINETICENKGMTQCVAKFIQNGNDFNFIGIIEEASHYKNQKAMELAYKNRMDIKDNNVKLILAYHPGDVFDGKELYDMFGERYTNIG